MGKSLIIAEKPSVAQDIARALGNFEHHKQYYESDTYVLAAAVGHLLELDASAHDVKRGKWSFAHLPVLPEHFALKPIERSEDQLKLLVRLMRRKDITGFVNACDAGREGELIFRYLVDYAEQNKPILRLWLQSMTPQAIVNGFSQLRPDEELRPLAAAARSRAESDWLVGINGTRAMTAFNSQQGGFHKTPVGRVQTPTLSMLVAREKKIRDFVSRNYWELSATFTIASGDYIGRWFDPAFNKAQAGEDQRAERLWDEVTAKRIERECLAKDAQVEEESKPVSRQSPLLFDLTSLQREANNRFGFSARATLKVAQSLYERHKALTYPRTDSRALPEDYLEEVKRILKGWNKTSWAAPAQRILKEGWVQPNKRIFNNSKISDHFAIIPTGQIPKTLSEPEVKLYELVVRRFLAIFFPAAEYLTTTRLSHVGAHVFRSDGRVLKQPGWLEVYGHEVDDDAVTLPPLEIGEIAKVAEIHLDALQTKPPARYTEATLLSAMEGAGKLVEDEELRAAMAAKGLGTPATRAQIIEGLILDEYLQRTGRELQPSAKAFDLIFALESLKVEAISSPELTGQWEYRLHQIENGELSRAAFMAQISTMTSEMVHRIKNGSLPEEAFSTLQTPCPKCGGMLKENYRKFSCGNCDYALWKLIAGRQWLPQEMDELLQKGQIGPLTGFRSRLGRPFSALVRLNDAHQPAFDFGETASAPQDLSERTPLGPCPICKAPVYDIDTGYRCATGIAESQKCAFRSGKVILQQPIAPEQMEKLLSAGRTELLTGFVSARTHRRFSAYLTLNPEGKVGFEFEKRPEKKTATRRSRTTTSSARSASPAAKPSRSRTAKIKSAS